MWPLGRAVVNRRYWAIMLLLLFSVGMAAWAGATVSCPSLPQSLQLFYDRYQPLQPPLKSGRLEDLEIMVTVAVMQAQERMDQAQQLQFYLQTYFPASSLLPLLDVNANINGRLRLFEPDPLFSRLVKDSFVFFKQHPRQADRVYFQQLAALAELFWRHHAGARRQDLKNFLAQASQSPFSGFAAYALAWQDFQDHQGNTEGFYHLWQQDRDHPAARESFEAMEVPYFSPRRLSLASAVMPGWGEEQLEPGMGEAGSQLYYELLFWAGTIGFTMAAQQQARTENITAALIFSNLLIMNHQGSAARTWVMAQRRNRAEEKRFLDDHFQNNLIAPGRFKSWSLAPVRAKPPDQRLIIGPFLQLRGLADALASTGWVQDSSLTNAGLSLGYELEFLNYQSGTYSLAAGLRPQLDLYFNPLFKNAQDGPLHDNGWQSEQTSRVNVVISQAWTMTEEQKIYINVMAGPGYRWQHLNLGEAQYHGQAGVGSAGLSLGFGGPAGHYWSAGIMVDDSFHSPSVTFFNTPLTLSSLTWRMTFELSILF